MQLTEEIIRRIARQESRKVVSTYIFNGAGGSSEIPSLEGLEDTTITDPQDKDVLVYNGTSEKWENNAKAPVAEKADEADKVKWTGVQNVITDGNQFNVVDGETTNNSLFINRRKRDGTNLTNSVQEIYFYNGAGAMTGVTVHAANFEASGQVTALSDESKKDVKGNIVLNLDDIANAPSVKFRWKDETDGKTYVGTIAQYWQKVMPEVVREAADGTLSMDYAVAALISSISLAKELKELKQTLKDRGIL